MGKLTIIQGTPAPATPEEAVRKRLRKSEKPAEMLQCHRCGCRELFEARTGVMYREGRSSGGTKALLCSACFMKGQRVVVG